MPRITLPASSSVYDLYERLVAAAAGVTTDKTQEAITSILPRSCSSLVISFPDVSPNSGNTLTLTGEMRQTLDPASTFGLDAPANLIPLQGTKLQATVNNAVVDITTVVN